MYVKNVASNAQTMVFAQGEDAVQKTKHLSEGEKFTMQTRTENGFMFFEKLGDVDKGLLSHASRNTESRRGVWTDAQSPIHTVKRRLFANVSFVKRTPNLEKDINIICHSIRMSSI